MSQDAGTDRFGLLRGAEAWRGPLLRYAARLVGAGRMEDVVQEAYFRLGATPSPPGGERLGPWLFCVCRNIALDTLRKDDRMTRLSDAQGESRPDPPDPPDPGPGPGAAAEQRETLSAVMRAVDALPPRQQEVIRLKFQNGFSYQQIAEVTGLTVGYVGLLIHQGVQAVKQEVGAELPPAPKWGH